MNLTDDEVIKIHELLLELDRQFWREFHTQIEHPLITQIRVILGWEQEKINNEITRQKEGTKKEGSKEQETETIGEKAEKES